MKHFEHLSELEISILKETLPKVGALIANADGKVDIDEVYWAEKMTNIRTYGEPHELNDFYNEVAKDFKQRFEAEIKSLPDNTEEARKCLSEDIARINDILPKLGPDISYRMYKSFTTFAKHIAKASGGFLGFFSIDSEEAKLIDLPMVNPIAKPEGYIEKQAETEEDEV